MSTIIGRRLIDCFLFYNELDLLEYRLRVLSGVVDIFVLVEAAHTFMGRPKALLFYENRERFRPYLNRLVVVTLSSMPHPTPNVAQGEQWINESAQRNALLDGVRAVPGGVSGSDIVLLSDVDEIFDPNTLFALRQVAKDDTLYCFKQQYHSYNLNVVRDIPWCHPKAFTVRCWETALGSEPYSSVRARYVTVSHTGPALLVLVDRGGWHLSWFGDAAFVVNKIDNFSHQEFNLPSVRDEGLLRERMSKGMDIMGRDELRYRTIPACRNPYLPPLYLTLLRSYLVM